MPNPLRRIVLALLVALALPFLVAAAGPPAWRDPALPIEARVKDLLARMTLEEKVAQLGGVWQRKALFQDDKGIFNPAKAKAVLGSGIGQVSRPSEIQGPGGPGRGAREGAVYVNAIQKFLIEETRLGVPAMFHEEAVHGFVAVGGTNFPVPIGLASTWDVDLLERVMTVAAREARARGIQEVLAPVLDLARDPRWGRTEEVYGEDPFLVGTLATAFTRGLQGDDPRYWTTAALLKHFLANSNEDGRTSSSSDFDERLWREYYAKPFEMAVRQGGSRAMMAAYNAVNGIPAHVHPMLRDIVVKEWGQDGILCTDGGGLRLLVSDHKAFPDLPSAAAACIKAGINHFLDRHKEAVTEAVKRGLLTETDIDQALRGLFRVSIRLGLLDPPDRVPYATIGGEGDPEPWGQAETRALVREVTRKSIVLLKNSAGLLPLDRTKVKSVAVVGPLANQVLLDWYSGTPPYAVSPREGIERVANPGPPGSSSIGVNWVGDTSDAAVELARRQDVAVVCVGNHPEGNAGWEVVTSPSEGKEAVDRKAITLPPEQEELVRRVYEANARTVVVLVTSFPVALPWAAANAATILHVTHASQELGNALADVLFGDANPGGRLAQTWPRSLDQLPPMMDYDIRHGRTYLYFRGEPQFPFGYGLSYTTFAHANLRTSAPALARGGAIDVSVDVTNTGARAGDEVVQLYVRYPESRVERPGKQLRGFRRASVAPGETRTVVLRLAAADLAYWDVARHAWTVEPGRVELMVGSSSADADLSLRRSVAVTR
jgi:beta-glucosidase